MVCHIAAAGGRLRYGSFLFEAARHGGLGGCIYCRERGLAVWEVTG